MISFFIHNNISSALWGRVAYVLTACMHHWLLGLRVVALSLRSFHNLTVVAALLLSLGLVITDPLVLLLDSDLAVDLEILLLNSAALFVELRLAGGLTHFCSVSHRSLDWNDHV